MLALWIALCFALAAFVHTTAGFGSALVAMAILVPLIGLAASAPLVAMVVLPLQIIIVWRYRDLLDFKAVRVMIAMLLVGTPIGIWGIAWLNEQLLLSPLGIIILAFVLYTALSKQQRTVNVHEKWLIPLGIFAGILNGAYNSGGPLIVMAFKSRNDTPDVFRVNLQMTFIFGTIIVILSHLLNGNITPDVLRFFVIALPAMVVGFGAGQIVARHLNQQIFDWIVLGLLAILGFKLLLS